MFKFDRSSGQVSRLLLVLAAIVLVAVVIVYLVMKMVVPPPKPPQPTGSVIPQPVYEKQLGNIRFVFESSQDLGNVLLASKANGQNNSYLKDIKTTERFVVVTVGAQNKGRVNIPERAWDLKDIVDSDDNHFIPMDQYAIAPWLPTDNACGALLEPQFDPLACTKIYKVAKTSKGLKVTVATGKNNDPGNFSSSNLDQALLDLIIK